MVGKSRLVQCLLSILVLFPVASFQHIDDEISNMNSVRAYIVTQSLFQEKI